MLGFGPFELHPGRRQLCRGGQPLALRATAFELLLALAEQPGEVVDKLCLCERAWPGREASENSLQVEIAALRKLLGSGAIVTAYGRGYLLAWPVTRTAAAGERFIGRDADLASLQALLAPGVVVSVVGEGGIGKTRLALALAQRHASACVVQLDEVRDAAGAVRAIAAALKLAAATPRELVASMKSWPGLMVLDTCDAAAQPLAELLTLLVADGPLASWLLTSREALRMPLEKVYRLGPLAHDDAAALWGAEHMPASLDGNPLAIELAAGRVPAAPARHRSLAASFDWSWHGLQPAEQQLLLQLAQRPQPVLLADLLARASGWAQVETLARLVDKSMLSVESTEPPSYRVSSATLQCLQPADLQR